MGADELDIIRASQIQKTAQEEQEQSLLVLKKVNNEVNKAALKNKAAEMDALKKRQIDETNDAIKIFNRIQERRSDGSFVRPQTPAHVSENQKVKNLPNPKVRSQGTINSSCRSIHNLITQQQHPHAPHTFPMQMLTPHTQPHNGHNQNQYQYQTQAQVGSSFPLQTNTRQHPSVATGLLTPITPIPPSPIAPPFQAPASTANYNYANVNSCATYGPGLGQNQAHVNNFQSHQQLFYQNTQGSQPHLHHQTMNNYPYHLPAQISATVPQRFLSYPPDHAIFPQTSQHFNIPELCQATNIGPGPQQFSLQYPQAQPQPFLQQTLPHTYYQQFAQAQAPLTSASSSSYPNYSSTTNSSLNDQLPPQNRPPHPQQHQDEQFFSEKYENYGQLNGNKVAEELPTDLINTEPANFQ